MENKKYDCTVFYDGSCPLCKREISLYSKLDKKNKINWLDVSDPSSSIPEGKSREKLLSRLHLVDCNGEYHIGASAFFFIWNFIPGMKSLCKLKESRIIFNFTKLMYEIFLLLRPLIQLPFRLIDFVKSKKT